MSTSVHAAIAARFCAPQFATFFEVKDNAGFDGRRSADAVTMSLWPSRGLAFWGFEVKVSRADWLRELRNPEKSGPIQKFCDRWWIATSGDDVAKADELPETWGLLVLRGGKLVVAREAPALTPVRFTRGFVACLLRSATGTMVPKAIVEQAVAARLDEVVTSRRSSSEWALTQKTLECRKLLERVQRFEAASGVRIDDWHTDQIGKAVRLVMNEGSDQERMLSRVSEQLERLRTEVDAAVGELRALAAKNGARAETTDGTGATT